MASSGFEKLTRHRDVRAINKTAGPRSLTLRRRDVQFTALEKRRVEANCLRAGVEPGELEPCKAKTSEEAEFTNCK